MPLLFELPDSPGPCVYVLADFISCAGPALGGQACVKRARVADVAAEAWAGQGLIHIHDCRLRYVCEIHVYSNLMRSFCFLA